MQPSTISSTGSESNHPEWKNYTLSLDVKNTTGSLTPFGDEAIVVRKGSQSKSIGVRVSEGDQIYWASIGSNIFDTSEISGDNPGFRFSTGSNIEITVQGNNYTLQVDGRNVQTISILGYDFRGIDLGIQCDYGLQCPSFDNVKVTYLP